MANSDQIKALIRSHSDGDDARFYAVALQVAAQAARNGHGRLAEELRELVDRAKENPSVGRSVVPPGPIPLAQPRGELAGLLTVAYPRTRTVDMALDQKIRGGLNKVLAEQRQRERIRTHGLAPVRKLLLEGPPGTGKTMTAAALSGELALPLFIIRLDGLITKYMGETAARLRLVFDAIESSRGVYLFDEFDALGGERNSENDVGEIRRVLNSFLQFLEQDQSDSLIVAATNHVKLLDRALFRRFDTILRYQLPSAEIAVQVMKSRLAMFDTSRVDWDRAAIAAEGLSHAEITQACEQTAKNAILEYTTVIQGTFLIHMLEERHDYPL